MAEVKITAAKNGPFRVEGIVELVDANGDAIPHGNAFALCRCGASARKPFCDGSHSRIGFEAVDGPVPERKE